jgi:hypothetical protein
MLQPVTTTYSASGAADTDTSTANALVVVQRDWNGWKKAMAPASALQDVHWRQPAGAPRPMLHAYVSCAALISGMVPHECSEDAAPHRLLVCVLKCHTVPSVYDQLARLADEHAQTAATITAGSTALLP